MDCRPPSTSSFPGRQRRTPSPPTQHDDLRHQPPSRSGSGHQLPRCQLALDSISPPSLRTITPSALCLRRLSITRASRQLAFLHPDPALIDRGFAVPVIGHHAPRSCSDRSGFRRAPQVLRTNEASFRAARRFTERGKPRAAASSSLRGEETVSHAIRSSDGGAADFQFASSTGRQLTSPFPPWYVCSNGFFTCGASTDQSI